MRIQKINVISLLPLLIALFFVASISNAATTIGTNIITAGSVGVGTTTPFAKFAITGGGTGTGVNFQTANSSNVPLFSILDSGSVGIGTASPSSILSLESAPWTTMYVHNATNQGSSVAFGTDISGGQIGVNGSDHSNPGEMFVWSDGAYAIRFGTQGTERMRISSIGNVGIGTTTPQTKLHVTSGASATTTITIGELGLTSSKSCVNMNRADGGAGSFYISAAGAMVVESNYCR